MHTIKRFVKGSWLLGEQHKGEVNNRCNKHALFELRALVPRIDGCRYLAIKIHGAVSRFRENFSSDIASLSRARYIEFTSPASRRRRVVVTAQFRPVVANLVTLHSRTTMSADIRHEKYIILRPEAKCQ